MVQTSFAHDAHLHLKTRIEAAMKAYGLPVIPIGIGCWSLAEVDLMKLQGREIDWSKLELARGEVPQTFLIVGVLQWQLRTRIY